MLPPYEKPFLRISEQLALLQARGLNVSDVPRAEKYLERIGYYRLSGYWYPMRKPVAVPAGQRSTSRQSEFLEGAEFRHVIQLYVFDKRLRLLFLDAIERIEVGIRVAVALRLGARDPIAHRKPAELHPRFVWGLNESTMRTNHQDWLERQNRLEATSKEVFIEHFRARYSSELPIWIAIELWDFGMLSHLFNGMRIPDIEALSKAYGLDDWKLLPSWLQAINFVRNVCAHHSRLWNRVLINIPRLPKAENLPCFEHVVADKSLRNRLYTVAVIIQYLMRYINPASSWAERLKALTSEFPIAPGLEINQAGFQQDWWKQDIWNC